MTILHAVAYIGEGYYLPIYIYSNQYKNAADDVIMAAPKLLLKEVFLMNSSPCEAALIDYRADSIIHHLL